jgi:protein-tyrosine phosphatase
MHKIKIVFVCLGNYCRSPMAEGIMTTFVAQDGRAADFDISSAGTMSWDVGLRPDPRSLEQLEKHGYALSPQKRARMITDDEIHTADYVIAMTQQIAHDLGNGPNVHLLLDFVPEIASKDIPDPYPTHTFAEAFDLIEQGVKAFYVYLKQKFGE